KVGFKAKCCAAPGRGIENILFRNLSYDGCGGQEGIARHEPNMSLILGYDSLRTVRNVRFENFRINGKHIHDDMPGKPKWYKTSDMGNIFVNDHVKEVTFR
ncbi:MAG: endo-polygalacturonase, partial [Bacteroidaceae bacterium]